MTRKYPRITERKKFTRPTGTFCTICKAPALYRCNIEYNIFRGEDESEHRCEEHSRDKRPA